MDTRNFLSQNWSSAHSTYRLHDSLICQRSCSKNRSYVQQRGYIPATLAHQDNNRLANDQRLKSLNIPFNGNHRCRGSSSRAQRIIKAADANGSQSHSIHVLLYVDFMLLSVDPFNVPYNISRCNQRYVLWILKPIGILCLHFCEDKTQYQVLC